MAAVTNNGTVRTIQYVQDATNRGKFRQNTKSYEKFSYFLGGIDVTHQNLDQFTPYIRGVSRIFLHKPPLFMWKLDGEMTRRFKTYVETGYKSISGIGDISVDFTQFEGGFNGQQFSTPQLARDDTESVTISVYELTGSPIREYLDTWVTGVRDPRSGIAHYHGLIDKLYGGNSTGMEYAEINHTAEFIYTTYDPTGLWLEYCCMFAHCFPRRVPKDHLNYEAGNRDNVQMDMEFATTKYESPAINDIGVWYTNASRIKWNYLDFDPEQNFTGTAGSGVGYSGTTTATPQVYTYHYGRSSNTPNDRNTAKLRGTTNVMSSSFDNRTRNVFTLTNDQYVEP